MPCDTLLRQNQTIEQRMAETRTALAQLEARLQNGAVRVNIGPGGAVAFACWSEQDRRGLSDVCTLRLLTAQGSPALRMALARAEAMTGRRANMQAVAAGVHSHDGGRTWSKH